MMKNLLFSATIAGCLALTSVAHARPPYDGSWDLVFLTQRGACDATYNFSVNINDGVVTHPNLVIRLPPSFASRAAAASADFSCFRRAWSRFVRYA